VHGPSSSRASKNPPTWSVCPAPRLSSRASKTSRLGFLALLQGRQGRTGHLPPGQARRLHLDCWPSSRASKRIRPSHLQGKQEARPRASAHARTPFAFLPADSPSPGLLALEETWVPPPRGLAPGATGPLQQRTRGKTGRNREREMGVTGAVGSGRPPRGEMPWRTYPPGRK
jgi:hypothetical protein